jgi:hypothetical protein
MLSRRGRPCAAEVSGGLVLFLLKRLRPLVFEASYQGVQLTRKALELLRVVA